MSKNITQRRPEAASARIRALRIAGVYALFSLIWILFSDQCLNIFAHDLAEQTWMQTIKGWAFVLVTGALIFVLLSKEIKKQYKAEKLYRTIFDNHFQMTGLMLPDGILISANEAALGMIGAEESDVLGHYFWETPWWAHTKELQALVRDGVKKAAGGEFVRFETTHPGEDGELHIVDFSIRPVRDEKGKVGFLVPEGRDMTEIRKNEQDLHRLYSAVEQAQVGITILSPDLKMEYLNPAYESLTGMASGEMLGRSAFDINGEQVEPQIIRNAIEEAQSDGVWSGRITRNRVDGSTIETDVTVSPVYGETEQVTNYVVSHRDVTERVELEKMVAQSQKMEAIGSLASGIAHDFNNILAAIVGYTELATIDLDDPAKAQEDLAQVMSASNRARDLVRQILTFSQQGKQETQPVDLKIVAKEVIKLLHSTMPKNIEFDTSLDSSSLVIADPTQLHQVLMNLCTNAGHAMSEKGGTLGVKLDDVVLDNAAVANHPGVTPGEFLRMSISDTGHGIRPEMLSRVFEPFFTTKGRGEGTGLGLSVVHGIVKDAGGFIDLKSTPGSGTIFHVHFPKALKESAGAAPEKYLENGVRGTERILFVDDEITLCELAENSLGRLGYKVEAFSSSEKAFEHFKLHNDSFDAVITDLEMPGMNGDVLAKHILLHRPDIPILLCTGFSERINEEMAKSMGIMALAHKPIVFRELALKLRGVFDVTSLDA